MNKHFLAGDIAAIAQQLGPVANDFAGKTMLLSGGRGFLGRYFTEVFLFLNQNVLANPCKLIVLDNFITSGKHGAQIGGEENIQFFQHDVIQPFDPGSAADIDFVVHAAGIASPYYYRAYPLETLEVAISGTHNLLKLAAERSARFTFFSSSEIYGDPDPVYVPTPESYRGNVTCQGPRACYDESKRVGETLCYIFHQQTGTHTNTIRPFNVFGPGMQEADYRVMPNFASRIKGGLPLNIYGDGNQTRTFCYISDAINGFLRVVARGVPGEAYNIGNPKPEISMLGLASMIETVLSRKIPVALTGYPDSYPADEPNRRCPDIRKARIQLEYDPQVKLADGLRKFLDWTDRTYCGEQ